MNRYAVVEAVAEPRYVDADFAIQDPRGLHFFILEGKRKVLVGSFSRVAAWYKCGAESTNTGSWKRGLFHLDNGTMAERVQCSECGITQEHESFYCPFCGAKMEGIRI